MAFDAVILAGGASSRMKGRDKSAELVGGRSLLDLSLEAASGARRKIVVGPDRCIDPSVVQVVERDPGGPVAGIAAGLAHVMCEKAIVLACDMPFVSADFVVRLLGELVQFEAAFALDADGRSQFLPCAFRRQALEDSLRSLDPYGAPLGKLFDRLAVGTIPDGGVCTDCDTPEDLEAARRAVRMTPD